jgi:outer membrane protein
MKPISWVINGVLAIAVIVLYFLHFKAGNMPTNRAALIKGSMKIAYFEIDSIENNYIYFKELKASLETKEEAYTKQLDALNKQISIKEQEYEKLRPKLSSIELSNREEELNKLYIDKSTLAQKITQDLQVERENRLFEIKKKIDDYLAIYNKDKGFAYIFSNDPGLMYYKDNAYDITADVIKGLNEAQTAKK